MLHYHSFLDPLGTTNTECLFSLADHYVDGVACFAGFEPAVLGDVNV
jgi:hypothetical protein